MFGMFIAAGSVLGYFAFRRHLLRAGAPELQASVSILAALGCGWVGAKAYYLIMEADPRWLQQPLAAFLEPRGHAFLGGLIGAALALVVVTRWARRRLHSPAGLGHVFDAAAPAWFIGYVCGRIGCHVTGDGCYGICTDLPWGMSYPHGLVPTLETVHPTPLYESAATIVGLCVLRRVRRRRSTPGDVFAVALVFAGSSRFLVEFLRRNPLYGPFTGAQWISIAVLIPLGMAWFAGDRSRWRIARRGLRAGQIV